MALVAAARNKYEYFSVESGHNEVTASAASSYRPRQRNYLACILSQTQSLLLVMLPLLVVLSLALLVCSASPASAQAVTWTQNDINAGSLGSYVYTPGAPPSYSITGSGTGVGAIDDSYTFLNTPAAQSMYIQGRVASQTNTGAGALAGFCIRNSVQTSYAYS